MITTKKRTGIANKGIVKARKAEITANQAFKKVAWDKLTSAQKLAALDIALGVGLGARKQRYKLHVEKSIQQCYEDLGK